MAAKKTLDLQRAGHIDYNKPKRTPSHPTKSHIVVAKEGDGVKTIRFGQRGVKTNQTASPEERKHLSLVTPRISRKERCLRLIGRIKLNGLLVRQEVSVY